MNCKHCGTPLSGSYSLESNARPKVPIEVDDHGTYHTDARCRDVLAARVRELEAELAPLRRLKAAVEDDRLLEHYTEDYQGELCTDYRAAILSAMEPREGGKDERNG